MGEQRFRRREVIVAGAGAVAAGGLGIAFWKDLLGGDGTQATVARAGGASSGAYGRLAAPDEHGIRLPPGFRSRLVARGGDPVALKDGVSDYRWHRAPDGAATFETRDGGWILVSNSEVVGDGGAGAVRFGPDGEPRAAYRILEGTALNCGGGATPWGTWLSCEEYSEGRVWECDPAGRRRARVHDAMGVFKHEAAAVDPRGRRVYLTEDLMDGALYRFTPRRWPDLAAGLLEVASVRGARVQWTRVPDARARSQPTRRQVKGTARFKRAEGIWFDDGIVYVATTGDSKIRALDTRRDTIETIYDAFAMRGAPIVQVDQITASRAGELFVCEDIATETIHLGVMSRARDVSRFLAVTGRNHASSELTGVAFDPSGSRLYIASQRAHGERGEVYEVSGPFRGRRRG